MGQTGQQSFKLQLLGETRELAAEDGIAGEAALPEVLPQEGGGRGAAGHLAAGHRLLGVTSGVGHRDGRRAAGHSLVDVLTW